MTPSDIILSQISAIDPYAFMAWGAKDFVKTEKGLRFRVGGLAKFKGVVHLKYNEGTDLYDIDFFKFKKGFIPKVVKTSNSVFAEDLVKVIGDVVQ